MAAAITLDTWTYEAFEALAAHLGLTVNHLLIKALQSLLNPDGSYKAGQGVERGTIQPSTSRPVTIWMPEAIHTSSKLSRLHRGELLSIYIGRTFNVWFDEDEDSWVGQSKVLGPESRIYPMDHPAVSAFRRRDNRCQQAAIKNPGFRSAHNLKADYLTALSDSEKDQGLPCIQPRPVVLPVINPSFIPNLEVDDPDEVDLIERAMNQAAMKEAALDRLVANL